VATELAFADTNLFLRYLTNDVPEQADAVEGLLRRAQAGAVSLVTSSLVMAEIVWTLESYYQLTPQEVQAKVQAMVHTPGLKVAEAGLILQAAVWHAEKNVDFIDAYNAAWLLAQDIHTAYTFDLKHFGRLEGLNALAPARDPA
jgi:predicted nucleic acid-binding protein